MKSRMIQQFICQYLDTTPTRVGVATGDNLTLITVEGRTFDQKELVKALRAHFGPSYVDLGLVRFL